VDAVDGLQFRMLLDFISPVLVTSDRSCAVAPVPDDGVSLARVAGVAGSGATLPDGVVVVPLLVPGVEVLPESVAPANAVGVM
jgi:hypothetical protein